MKLTIAMIAMLLFSVVPQSAEAAEATGISKPKNLLMFPGDTAIGQIANGEGWTTELIFVNLQDVTRTFDVFFTADNGGPLFLNWSGIGVFSSIRFILPPRNSLRTKTNGLGFPVVQGWGEIKSADGDFTAIGGMAVFRRALPGLPDLEAVVPFGSIFQRHQFLPFNHLGGFVTGLALVNPSLQWEMTIAMDFYDQNGVLIISRLIRFLPQEHTAFVLPWVYPELEGRVGLIEFSVWASLDTIVGPVILGLRFNPGGAFTTIFPMQSAEDLLQNP